MLPKVLAPPAEKAIKLSRRRRGLPWPKVARVADDGHRALPGIPLLARVSNSLPTSVPPRLPPRLPPAARPARRLPPPGRADGWQWAREIGRLIDFRPVLAQICRVGLERSRPAFPRRF